MHSKTPVASQHWNTNKVVWFSTVITLQLTIFTSMSSWQYTILRCQEYVFSAVKLSQFLQYLSKHALQSSSCFITLKDQQSGLDMVRWLIPWRTSTYERPFTWKGNYLVFIIMNGLNVLKIWNRVKYLKDILPKYLLLILWSSYPNVWLASSCNKLIRKLINKIFYIPVISNIFVGLFFFFFFFCHLDWHHIYILLKLKKKKSYWQQYELVVTLLLKQVYYLNFKCGKLSIKLTTCIQ